MNLNIPSEIKALIDTGIWPKTQEKELQQNSLQLLKRIEILELFPDNEKIYLFSPPFITISEDLKTNKFWNALSCKNQIDYKKSLIIGDLGHGSDASIILNFEQYSPKLMYLYWNDKCEQENCFWKNADLDTFCKYLALGNN